MPIYEYECERCSLRFELRKSFNDDGSGFCPRCGGEARRLFTAVPIIFKGSGFYITDSRKNGERPKDNSQEKGDEKGGENN